jgi:hypothetical protein
MKSESNALFAGRAFLFPSPPLSIHISSLLPPAVSAVKRNMLRGGLTSLFSRGTEGCVHMFEYARQGKDAKFYSFVICRYPTSMYFAWESRCLNSTAGVGH